MADKKNLPTTDALKERFKAGSIPLQSDFADLIDMAAAGASATGVAAGQNGEPGLGMRLSSDGKLEPNVESHDYSNSGYGALPVRVDSSTNTLVVDLDLGLTSSTDGVAVKAATGIKVDDAGVSVAADIIANAQAGAKAVGKYSGQDGEPGAGMRLSDDGKLEPNATVRDYAAATDGQGYSPVAIDRQSNALVVDLGFGLEHSSGSGLVVKSSTGITVDKNGVSVNMAYVVPRGIIVMFSGSSAPTGWAFCNGSNGTPDLRDRFIKGSSSFSTSTGGSKTYTYTPAGSITVNSHTLTVAEMPEHRHNFTRGYADKDVTGSDYTRPMAGYGGWYDIQVQASDWMSGVGGNKGHSHTGSFKGSQVTMNNEPQYYALAFIMKL